MNISFLREFIDLGNTLNFGETANNMFISQSSLSKHIGNMEKELGVQLFTRSKQSVQLTDMGHLFFDKAKKIVALYDSATYELKNASQQMSGTLRVSFLDAAVRSILGQAVHEFRKQFPNINVILHSGELGEVERKVKQDEVDLALTIQFPNSVLAPGWLFHELFPDVLAAVIPRDNPLAGRDTVSFSDLIAYPMVLPDPYQYPDYAKLIKKMEERSGYANVVCEFTHVDTALVMVDSSSAIAIIPKHLECYPHTTHFIQLDDEGSEYRVGALWKENTPAPGILQFVSLLEKYASKDS